MKLFFVTLPFNSQPGKPMKAIIFLLLIYGCSAAQTNVSRLPASTSPEYLNKSLIFIATGCYLNVVNMLTGEIGNTKGDLPKIGCRINKYTALCRFLDSGNKFVAEREMVNVVSGQEAVLSNDSQSDVIILNLVTKKFFLSSNVYVQNGKGRGQKTCSGEAFYEDEFKK